MQIGALYGLEDHVSIPRMARSMFLCPSWLPLGMLLFSVVLTLAGCSIGSSDEHQSSPPAAQVVDPAPSPPETPPSLDAPPPVVPPAAPILPSVPLLPASSPPVVPVLPGPGVSLPPPVVRPTTPPVLPGTSPIIAPASETRYAVLDLGPGLALAIDTDGTVAGATRFDGELLHAALLTPVPHQLPFLPEGTFSQAAAVRAQLAVGESSTGRNGIHTHATLWQTDGTAVDLAAGDDPNLFSAATALADATFVVGFCDDLTAFLGVQTVGPCFWAGGQTHHFATLGGPGGIALATCSGCPTVGQSATADHQLHATLWVMGSVIDLDTTGGAFSTANALTPQGVIVGAATFGSTFHAFARTLEAGAVMQDLGVLPGLDYSEAFGVQAPCASLDASCHIVGESWRLPDNDPTGVISRATLWEGTTLVDLNTRIDDASGWILERATAMNAAGMIVGFGRLQGQRGRAFLLVPLALVATAP